MGNLSYDFRIGIDSLNYFRAKVTIDEVDIYNHALSASEIRADYYADSSEITPSTPDYDSVWRNPTGNPVGYLDILKLMAHPNKILTDSGDIQKETYIIDVSCVTCERTSNGLRLWRMTGMCLSGRIVGRLWMQL